ncbi:MAG TPA: Ig-like domain-containing protein [Solirubrobacteraceae bacterium]|nr:Ig-like domain-containing protein [Solirubrobacteraceae bacterium]
MPAVKNALCATALAFGLSAASLLAAPALAAAAAPELTIAAPAGFTDNPSPTFKGTTTDEADGVTVRVFVGSSTGGAPAETVTPGLADPAAGAWTDEGGFLADGQYTAFAEQTHEGERGESPPVTFTIDTTHPEVSMSTVASFTSNTTPTLLGNAGAAPGDKSSVTVRLFAGSSTGGVLVNEQVVSAPGGAWSYGAPTLAQGTYTAQAAQDDEAGNEGLSAPQTFTVDTTGPAVAVNLLSSPTNNSKPSITGHLGAAPGDVSTVSVVVYQGAITGGTTAAEGTATNTGETSWSFSPHLEDGQYTVQAIQSDKAGNITKSNEVTFTIDTKPPLVAVKAPSGFVKSTTPTIEGTGGTAPGDLSPVTVRIFKGSGTSGSPVSTSSPTLSSGSWSFVSPTSLTEGTYTIQAVQRDEAGNEGSSSPMQFTVDMKKPVVTISAPKRNEIVHVSQPTFAGAAGEQPGDIRKVKLQINEVTETGKEVKVQELTLQSTSTWSTDTTTGPHFPPEGHYVAIVEQSDEAGNTETVKVPFSVEARSPNVTLAKSGLAEREPERLYAGATPTFSGGAQAGEKDSATVYLRIFEGSSSTGHEVEEVEGKRSGTSWVIGPIPALADGTYTAQAEQTALGEENGFSTPATFTVDADAPHPAILAPVNGTALASTTIGLTGAAGTSPGDDGAVTAEVFPGSAATGAPTETITVPANGGSWSAPLGTLPAGTYTALALQSDDVGNSGASAPVTFSLSEPAPPTASFTWFPTAPHVGESISLVSTSIDPTSAIVGYGWSLAGTGVYTPGGQTIGTSFTTPGNHVVQLLVTDQNGASSSISETILVTTTPVSLMQPFPVVRIAGSEGSAGVKIKLLSVQAPIGAKVSIACKGKGCPAKLVSALAAASKGKHPPGSALIVFKRFQRLLPPGVTLEIKVSKAGEIGKFTRFVSRKHKLPTRSDSCLSLLGKPMACPST